jgi:hypothetical protein
MADIDLEEMELDRCFVLYILDRIDFLDMAAV